MTQERNRLSGLPVGAAEGAAEASVESASSAPANLAELDSSVGAAVNCWNISRDWE